MQFSNLHIGVYAHKPYANTVSNTRISFGPRDRKTAHDECNMVITLHVLHRLYIPSVSSKLILAVKTVCITDNEIFTYRKAQYVEKCKM